MSTRKTKPRPGRRTDGDACAAWKKEMLSIFPRLHELNLLSSLQLPTAAKSRYKMILTDGCEI